MTPKNLLVPTVLENDGKGERAYDLYSRLMKDRIIFLGSDVNDQSANLLISQMLYLDMVDLGKDINFYINSPGGSVSAGLAIYDTMRYLQSPVATYCMGMAASMGAVLLCAGTKGKRFALPHSRVMIHQPLGGMQGKSEDMKVQYEQMEECKKDLYNILSEHTGQTFETIEKDCRLDNYMRPVVAQKYGLIDNILLPKKPI
jgi:ATP-dependent Clp protease, protease subunit